MATLRHDRRTGNWQIRFYWGGTQQERSCRTKNRSKALRTLVTVEDTLELLKSGRITIPSEVATVDWILSGGKLPAKLAVNCSVKEERFGKICEAYLEDQKHKQDTTLCGEKVHIRHLKKLLKTSTPIQKIDFDAIKLYRRRRSRQQYHGKTVSDATIKKELVTFRQVWIWARQNGYAKTQCPLLDDNGKWKLTFEKPDTQEKFKTWDQINRRIGRGGLSDEESAALWKGLFLDNAQVCELLDHVRVHAKYPFINPMFAFAAYTGARRSEILRSEIEDFDLESNQVTLRERKRRKDRKGSTRLVPLHPKLKQILEPWFALHPGGHFTLAPPTHMPRRKKGLKQRNHLTSGQAHRHFEMTLRGTKWDVVPGFHVLRHSFGSNLIRTGKVPSDVVAKWMGHTTLEMRDLYQHLFPQDGLQQITVLS